MINERIDLFKKKIDSTSLHIKIFTYIKISDI